MSQRPQQAPVAAPALQADAQPALVETIKTAAVAQQDAVALLQALAQGH